MSQFSMHADDHAMTYNVNATACKLGHQLRRFRGIHGVGCWVGYVITERMCVWHSLVQQSWKRVIVTVNAMAFSLLLTCDCRLVLVRHGTVSGSWFVVRCTSKVNRRSGRQQRCVDAQPNSQTAQRRNAATPSVCSTVLW